jgi:hypothetical protein
LTYFKKDIYSLNLKENTTATWKLPLLAITAGGVRVALK